MKKAIILAITLMIIFTSTAPAHAASGVTWTTRKAGRGYVTTFYNNGRTAGKIRTSKKVPVKILNSNKCSSAVITGRKGKYILVEKIKGQRLNKAGDGKTTSGHYISYHGIKGRKGTKYTTFAVYADNRHIDDIVIRIDKRR